MEKADGPLPNTRSTMYYQLSAFVDEARACEALPVSGVLRARLRLYASWPPEHTHAHTRIISRYYNPVKIWQRTRSLFTAGCLFDPGPRGSAPSHGRTRSSRAPATPSRTWRSSTPSTAWLGSHHAAPRSRSRAQSSDPGHSCALWSDVYINQSRGTNVKNDCGHPSPARRRRGQIPAHPHLEFG